MQSVLRGFGKCIASSFEGKVQLNSAKNCASSRSQRSYTPDTVEAFLLVKFVNYEFLGVRLIKCSDVFMCLIHVVEIVVVVVIIRKRRTLVAKFFFIHSSSSVNTWTLTLLQSPRSSTRV